MERMTARSSAHSATRGNNELMGIPLCPWFLNAQGLPNVLPLLLNWVGSIFILNGCPLSV